MTVYFNEDASGVSYNQNAPTALVRSAMSRMQDIISVKDFGALGNNSNDDTTAIQAAITYAAEIGAHVYFPFGTYLISASLVIPTNAYFMRLHGCGYGSQIKNKNAASFDLISFANPGSGNIFVCYVQIDNLFFNNNATTGVGNCLNTQYASNVYINDCYLGNFAAGGSGVFVSGNGETYSHEIVMRNLSFETSTGFAAVNFGSTSSDSSIFGAVGNLGNGCQYGLYFSEGAGNHQVSGSHIYSASHYSLALNTSSGSVWSFTDSIFDPSTLGNVYLAGCTNATFSNCKFNYANSGTSCLTLAGASTGNMFNNCSFNSGGTAQYGINETGTSNGNVFNQTTFLGTFSSAPFALIGIDSAVRVQGTDFILGGAVAVTSGNTYYIGLGFGTTSEPASEIPTPYAGYGRKLAIQCSNVPGTSQSFAATFRVNGSSTGLTATISGSSSFGATGQAVISVPEGGNVDVMIVASSGAASSTVRVSAVVNM